MKPLPRRSRTPRAPRRRVLAASAGCLALLATSACGGGDGGTSGASDGKPVTLTMWSWMVGTQDVVDAFNATHEDIQVKYTEITAGTDGYSKIDSAIDAGNAPDVVGMEYAMLPEFASQGNLEDLTEETGDLVGSFPESLRSLVTPGGRTWGVPFDVTPQLLYYRTDLFDKAGVEVPHTWAEFERAAEKIRKADGDVRIANAPKGGDVPFINGLAWQAGSQGFGVDGDAWTVRVDDGPARKVAAYWDGLVGDGLVRNDPAWSEEETTARKKGQVAAFIGAPWSGAGLISQLPEQKGKWAVAPLPTWDGTPATGTWGGTSFAVPKGSEHIDAATEFIEWLTTDPAAMKARLSDAEAPSSVLPAGAGMQKVAAAEFDGASGGYFANDLYEVAAAQVDTVVKGWTWGPVQGSVNEAFESAVAKGGWTAGFAAAQRAAVKALDDRGLKTSDG
ncbi:sugar ABC transporter substrate-binding protein [Streptomyces griseoviridis]|jgi:multiple sugar transport system substrate-binding protein|uniref:ABC transporter substrate-binding protein n=1 Tax=Streptomyces griseoviridis TaxID=45398 RepID=A0A918GJQ8_STRGD|nr:sugar ABC transporter substrate-binding protein [Streptomyces niveoruber]GGS40599.1 ABC transporter substrate-binding protein [Streptomyces niveoruber]